MRISDWSSDVCSSDLRETAVVDGSGAPARAGSDAGKKRYRRGCHYLLRSHRLRLPHAGRPGQLTLYIRSREAFGAKARLRNLRLRLPAPSPPWRCPGARSEEHTSELQSLMRNSYAVFCL